MLDWLKDPLNRLFLSEEEQAKFESMDFDELIKELEKRLKEQTEQHDGGSHWIGRGGTSPFGHSGYHPAGIRIGGESGGRHAVQIAAGAAIPELPQRPDAGRAPDKLALKKLRQLRRIGPRGRA